MTACLTEDDPLCASGCRLSIIVVLAIDATIGPTFSMRKVCTSITKLTLQTSAIRAKIRFTRKLMIICGLNAVLLLFAPVWNNIHRESTCHHTQMKHVDLVVSVVNMLLFTVNHFVRSYHFEPISYSGMYDFAYIKHTSETNTTVDAAMRRTSRFHRSYF